MNYYDEDFYAEPCEFEEQIEEFKTALAASVRQKFLDELDALRKENESLREFRDKKKTYELELAQAKAQYEEKMRDAESNANRKRLKDLLALFSVTGYRVRADYKQGPKCDKCDDRRKIHYISPAGRKMIEDCTCAVRTAIYFPKEVPLVSFYASDKLSDVYFEREDKDMDYDRYDMRADLYDKDKELPFEKINSYRVVFLKKEDCQRYCDWLNEKEAQKKGADNGAGK